MIHNSPEEEWWDGCCVCKRHSQDSQTLPGPTATEGMIPIL